jgi:preprotein translocase subunit SecF
MTTPVTEPSHGVLKRLYHGETRADIIGRWKVWFAISAVLLLIGIGALATKGLNLGIDFTGGTIWKVDAGKATVTEVTDAVTNLGYSDVQVQEVTETVDGKERKQIQVETAAAADPAKATTEAIDKATSSLKTARDKLPSANRSVFNTAYGNLSELTGPFKEDVPSQLTALQTEIDGLVKKVEGAKEAERASVAESAAASIEKKVEALSDLEDAQRRVVSQDVSNVLAKLTGTPVDKIAVDQVGPSWGKQISEKARTALIVFVLAIMIFISIRFELKMAIATVVALLHDLLMVVGLYALFGFAVTPTTVVALLTMLGFSIYDGIVVFDRVNENTKLLAKNSKMTYSEMTNVSLNQVLMRSLNTSITTALPIVSILVVGLVVGSTVLEDFGVALFLGLLSGAYSSLFVATPILALLKEREPRYQELRKQIAERGHGSVPEAEKAEVDDDPVRTAVTGGGPRPRKQGRKR